MQDDPTTEAIEIATNASRNRANVQPIRIDQQGEMRVFKSIKLSEFETKVCFERV